MGKDAERRQPFAFRGSSPRPGRRDADGRPPLDRSAAAEPVGALPQDDAEFVTIDGWVLRRDDLVRHGG
ncbi:hypothetical protein ACFSTI_12475 [Rhizorhabdus histidinilytica]